MTFVHFVFQTFIILKDWKRQLENPFSYHNLKIYRFWFKVIIVRQINVFILILIANWLYDMRCRQSFLILDENIYVWPSVCHIFRTTFCWKFQTFLTVSYKFQTKSDNFPIFQKFRTSGTPDIVMGIDPEASPAVYFYTAVSIY